METFTLVILGIFLFGIMALIGYIIMIYNGLVSLKENIKKSWSNIDVILKQRHDELPKLISVCESFAAFEKGMIDRITRAREVYTRARTVGEKSSASSEVTSAVAGLFAIAENYPELKSNNNFLKLQDRISHLEETLADRREFYNDTTNNYNIRIKQVPDVFVANFLCYRSEELFEVTAEDRRDVDVKIRIPQFN
ncbi:MAG: LemA family protein [Nitrospinaceae bacterium]